MKIACLVRPHIGGTFSLFRQLREGLADRGFELRWVTSGACDALSDDAWRAERSGGDVADPAGALSPERRAKELLRLIMDRRFDAVMFNVLGDPVETSLAKHIPASIARVAVVHNITPGTYAAARSIRDHVHWTICVAPRCRDDLVRRHGFDPTRTSFVMNAVDVDRAATRAMSPRAADGLRLLFLGRLEDSSKGVMWLPKILAGAPAAARLTIAGVGPDEARLRSAFARLGSRADFIGPVPPDGVPDLLARHDAMLMPSRYEGAPMSLIEAMAAGCVPIATRIHGVTDAIVEHDQSGLLFRLGDWRRASRLIGELEADRGRLAALSAGARSRALRACRLDDMADAYAAIFRRVLSDPPRIAAIEPWSPAALNSATRRPLRSRAPEPIKNWLRLMRERYLVGP